MSVPSTFLREFDWSSTPLGPRAAWSPALTTIYEMMLASPFAMCAGWGSELTLLYNDAYMDFLAGRHPAALGQPIKAVWHDIWTDIAPLIDQALAGKEVKITDLHLVMTRKGYEENTYWTFAYSPLRDGATVAGFLDIAIETTESVLAGQRRDTAEIALRQQNSTLKQEVAAGTAARDLFAVLIEHLPVGVSLLDANGQILVANPTFRTFLPGEPLPSRMREGTGVERWLAYDAHGQRLPPNQYPGARALRGELVMPGVEFRFQPEHGPEIWTAVSGVPLKDASTGQVSNAIVVLQDIDAQKRALEVAHANAERLQNALAAGAIIGTWFWDLPSDRFTVDEAFATAFGLDPALGRDGIPLAQIVATVHPDDQAGLAEAINEVIARGGPYAHQYRVRRRDGRYYWLEANGHVEHGPNGTPLRFPGVLLDIGVRRLDAALAVLSERLRTLETPQAMALAAAETVGMTLGLSRAAYGEVDAKARKVILAQDWLASGQQSAAGEHTFAAYGTYIQALKRGADVAIEDVTTDPRTAAQALNFQHLDIRALANLPLMEQGHLKVIFCLHASQPHAWTSDELAFARRVMERTEVEIARRSADAEVLDGAERLRLVIEGASDHAILTTDPHGIITSWSAGAQAIFGWSADEIVGQPARVIFTPEDQAAGAPTRELATAREHGCANDERWHATKSGGRVFMNGSVRPLPPDPQGRERGFMKIARDETERRRAHAELQELNATLEQRVAERTADRNSLWQLSSDLMLRCTFQGVMTAVNPAWTEVLGWREDELLGRTIFEFIHPDDVAHTIEGAQASSEGHAYSRFENRYRCKDDSYRWISWSTSPADGLINAVGRDATADKEQAQALEITAEALRQSQKMEAVGQLTGGVAHDFNNLLTIIRSSVDFLRRPQLPDDRKARYLDAVSDTVDRAAKLTGQLLAFARRQSLRPEVFDVGARLRGVGDMLDTVTGARVQVTIEAPDEPCFIHADVSQFETALINMAVNARDAMDGEGHLILRLACGAHLPPIRGHAGSASSFAAVSVIDTGSGIAPDQLGRIFEPFFTTKEVGKGTGLGLSQVFGFAKQSGGDVDVASVSGQGTTFTLYLPEVAAPAQVKETDADTPPAPVATGQRVLVVEDNVEVGRFCTQILDDLGYATDWATTGEEALLKLGHDGAGFDAVFSDVVMPGMGGITLAETLRDRLPGLPVVLTSGYSHILAQQADHGFELLHKPYSAEQLARVLQRVMQPAVHLFGRAVSSR
ncbi:PAS domain S-box protein [Methylobacterium terricola]|uniref:histidine kinase n=1 Tax=Methylobacterium terricola TaxID=2583531 RepID=A0A5C4LBT0_9HYPH|nr:PAS domain S-box protein [Methylobacterium terricola]TNC08761.1 PAS domain S-box protein [Methylobacterium terricola]